MKNLKVLFIIPILILLSACSTKEPKLLTYEQDLNAYVKESETLHVNLDNFYSRYFMPWSMNSFKLDKQKAMWANFVYKRADSYYAENLQIWQKKEVQQILKKTNFENFNQINIYAITSKQTQTRNLPTNKPFFKNPNLAGEGFPFDYLQNTLLHVNTPIIISHYSTDKAWAFVQSPVSFGWIKSDSFTPLNAQQRTKFKEQTKIVIIQDNSPIYSQKQEFITYVKLGALFAIEKEDEEFFYSYLFTSYGKLLHVKIPKSIAAKMPLQYNKENILHLSKQLLGEKYGWGGFLNNRDCSSMTKDFFTPFGLWLPRSSSQQKKAGEFISFEGLSNEEKEKMILKHGIAFLSLIYLPGHIMLYAGEMNNHAIAMHNIWGVKTLVDGQEQRTIVGKSILSDLYLGENQSNVDKSALLIAKAEGLIVQPDVSAFYVNPLTKAYPSVIKVEENRVYFDDNTTLEYHDYVHKDFQTLLNSASIKDTLSASYKAFEPITPPSFNDDAGRFRNEAFLKKLYGNDENEIKENLVQLTWVDGSKIYFNKKQNAAKQLQKVINELQKLPTKYDKYLTNIAGTFKYRHISGTKRLSPHSFAIAIDLNVKESAYWKWDKNYTYKNNFPKEIIDIFERFGFIWGGRWYHYDTMHFEYRPELFEYRD